MSMDSAHSKPASATPGPWRLDERKSFDGTTYIAGVLGADGERIRVEWFTLSSGPVAQANAALIVHAVNNHDALVQALQCAEAGLEFAGADKLVEVEGFVPTPLLALRYVRAAIAKATGAKP